MTIFPFDFLFFCALSFIFLYVKFRANQTSYSDGNFSSVFVCLFILPLTYWMLRTTDLEGLGFEINRPIGPVYLILACFAVMLKSYFLSRLHSTVKVPFPLSRVKKFKLGVDYIFLNCLPREFFFRQMMVVSLAPFYSWWGVVMGILASLVLKRNRSWPFLFSTAIDGFIFGMMAIESKSFLYGWFFHTLSGMTYVYGKWGLRNKGMS